MTHQSPKEAARDLSREFKKADVVLNAWSLDRLEQFLAEFARRARLEEARLWVSTEDELDSGLNEQPLCPELHNCFYCDRKRQRIAQLETGKG